jgi:hypothetical protein
VHALSARLPRPCRVATPPPAVLPTPGCAPYKPKKLGLYKHGPLHYTWSMTGTAGTPLQTAPQGTVSPFITIDTSCRCTDTHIMHAP